NVSSVSFEYQIRGCSSLRLGLGFVAGLDPIVEGRAPIGRPFGEPGKAAMLAHFEQSPCDIVRPIAGEQEEATGLEQAMEVGKACCIDEPPLVMARLRPWIGIEKIDAVE